MMSEEYVIKAEVVKIQHTEAGFALGINFKNCVQYIFSEKEIKLGTEVNVKFPEFQLL